GGHFELLRERPRESDVQRPLASAAMSIRFVIVGGGPGGNTAATVAARLGAEGTLVERDLGRGAATLWDCVPSKAMIAPGGFLSELSRAEVMGLAAEGRLDLDALRTRIAG